MTIQRNPATGRFERTWTPEKDAVLREAYRKVPDLELADRLNTSVDVLQHRAPKLGLRKYRLRRLPLSLQEIRDADRALKTGESSRSIARRLGTSHQVVNRAIERWHSTHVRERAKVRALELAREVPPPTTFRISDTVRREFGLIGNGSFPTPKRVRKWLNEAGLDRISRVARSSRMARQALQIKSIALSRFVGLSGAASGWVTKSRQSQPTPWALKLRDDAKLCGATEAGRRNPYPEGERKGQPVRRSAVYRIIQNLSEYEEGTLLPNRQQTPMGTWSRFKEDLNAA